MPPTTRLVPASSGPEWDALTRSVDGATEFHSWAWLQLTETLFDVRIERLMVLQQGLAIGVFPVVRSRARVKTFSLPFPFLGPLVPADHLSSTIDALRAWQMRHGLLVASFDLAPGVPVAADRVRRPGVTVVEDASIVVDLAHGSEERVVDHYSRMRKRSVKRSLAAGSGVRDAAPGELASLLGPVLEEAYGARGVASPYPPDTGAKVEAWAAGRDDVQVLTAVVDDEPAGVLVILTGSDVALSWVGGCLRRFRDAGPNVLLYHEQLLRSVRAGSTSMDLVGSVDDGIRDFKMAYGGHEAPYLRVQSRIGPQMLWRVARGALGLLRRARSARAEGR